MNEFQIFADNYSQSDFNEIRFDWNGKNGKDFQDNNYHFRMKLCQFLEDKLENVKMDLICDLFREMAKCAKQDWSISYNFHLFGQEILRRGTPERIMDYLFGAMQSFDTIISSGRFQLTDPQKQQIFEYISTRLNTETDEQNIRMLQFGLKRFSVNGLKN